MMHLASVYKKKDLSNFSLKVNLIRWIMFLQFCLDQLSANSIKLFNYICIVFFNWQPSIFVQLGLVWNCLKVLYIVQGLLKFDCV